MEFRYLIILVMLTNACHRIDAKLNFIPRNTEVMINDSTYLNCSTSLLANQVQWRHGKNYVYTGLAILEPYNERFSVEINASTGACNLVIHSVKPSDTGTYECAEDEGIGDRGSVQLIVLGSDPVCKSNTNSDGVIGPNSCGIEAEEVKLSCSIKYHGDSLPLLEWKASGDNQYITDGLFNATTSANKVTYTLTMKSTLGLSNSSFICQTTNLSDKHYSCSSDAINVLYVFSNEVTVNLTMNEEVSCFANTSQSCSYKWKWLSGDDSTTESDNQILKPKKVGMHRCEATCSLRNKSCSVRSLHAMVHEATSRQDRMSLLALLLVPSFVVIGVSVWCWSFYRKRKLKRGEREEKKRAEEERQRLHEMFRLIEVEKPPHDEIELQRREQERQRRLLGAHSGLIATICTNATEEEKQPISGLTILDNELFVANKKSSEVEIYDSVNFNFICRWNSLELINPRDMASCNKNKCLYISNCYEVRSQPNEILRLDKNGTLIKRWPTNRDIGRLSVTFDSNVILVAFDHNKLNEYSPDGTFIREIHLSSREGFCHPMHAIQLTNGHFVVSHGYVDDDLHRVCIVDADGKLLKSYGGKRGSTVGHMHIPSYLSVDGNGSVMVADHYNSRVLSLDSNLEFIKEIISYEHGSRRPSRIFLDELNGRLFVADNEQNNERILIFDLPRV